MCLAEVLELCLVLRVSAKVRLNKTLSEFTVSGLRSPESVLLNGKYPACSNEHSKSFYINDILLNHLI